MTVDHHGKIEKPTHSPSSSPQGPSTQDAKQDELQAKAKVRPERTANFKDYLVSNPPLRRMHQ
jgi:ATP-binding cassette, subfamily B (MDR/TAP), member 1